MMWNARRRVAPPIAGPGRTVDVFITTYDEPLDLVVTTAVAARDVRYPHLTWILDDGDRPEFRAAAERIGVGYITRGDEWAGRQRFAKAGNINNALFRTGGDFIAILDADQVPAPDFLEKVLGYFDDESVALVQTPQCFWNVPSSDPLGSQAELFYGPIQQGKDGWGAAFFCGSNAVLRREALMALGLATYSRGAPSHTRRRLRECRARLEDVINDIGPDSPFRRPLEDAHRQVRLAQGRIRRGEAIGEAVADLQQYIHATIVDQPELPTALVEVLTAAADGVEVSRVDEALAIQPINTATVTEDMATAMNLHAMGWETVYHHEVLVTGLAPEDVRTMLVQRQRWATGSMQVFFADNPMLKSGLTLAQRFMYLATMTSYLSGFAALVYIAAPLIYLTSGIFPMEATPLDFFARFIPFFVVCQILFLVAGHRSRGLWRGQQMSFALFPTWIAATLSAAAAVFLRRQIRFSVTPKTRAEVRVDYRPVAIQLVAMAALVAATVIGAVRLSRGDADVFPTYLSIGWVVLDLLLLSAVIRAARYRGHQPSASTAPDPSARRTPLSRRPVLRMPLLEEESCPFSPTTATLPTDAV